MIVQAMIEEKATLAEEKSQLKKKCKEEKKRLDEELQKMKEKKEQLAADEHAAVLAQIDAEFNEEHDRLMEQRRLVAQENRNVAAIQRKIENCPS